MLGEHAIGYVGGAGSCAGCGEATAIRMMVAATRQIHGPDSMGIVAATGCNTRLRQHLSVQPVPRAVDELAVRERPRGRVSACGRAGTRRATPTARLWVIGGDGAMYDIGFQALSRMVASGADIKVLVLDTQVYSNTGGQASTASFGGQVTKLSAFGERDCTGGPSRARSWAGSSWPTATPTSPRPRRRTSTTSTGRSWRPTSYPGPAVVIAYTACMPEHGIADDAATRQAKLAVDSRAFPLFTYDPRRGATFAERLSLQGNPALREDWADVPSGEPDRLPGVRAVGGPLRGPLRADGTPSSEILATQADRLANWRTLQELAGLLSSGTA